MSRTNAVLVLAGLMLTGWTPACRIPGPQHEVPPERSTWIPAENESIVVAGQRFHVGARVVLWDEPPHYDAYATKPRFAPPTPAADPAAADAAVALEGDLRYQPGRVRRTYRDNPEYVARPEHTGPGLRPEDERPPEQRDPRILVSEEVLVAPFSTDLAALRGSVDQFVLHYDVCGVSQTCFRVLQDDRKLSVHFLLDVDGTIYQTLDLRETAWHATKANPRSIGIEIANIGAYPPGAAKPLDTWYAKDGGGPYVRVPARLGDGGVRTPGFVGRPARPERVEGVIQGQTLEQFDFTPAQYESLVKLTATLCRVFPKIEPDAPRDDDGDVTDRALADADWREFRGILGHYHVQTNKTDPGPAFDWEPFLAKVRERIAESPIRP